MTAFHLNCSGCDQSVQSDGDLSSPCHKSRHWIDCMLAFTLAVRPTAFWLVAATANWVVSQPLSSAAMSRFLMNLSTVSTPQHSKVHATTNRPINLLTENAVNNLCLIVYNSMVYWPSGTWHASCSSSQTCLHEATTDNTIADYCKLKSNHHYTVHHHHHRHF